MSSRSSLQNSKDEMKQHREFLVDCAKRALLKIGACDNCLAVGLAEELRRGLVCKASLPAEQDTRTLSFTPLVDEAWYAAILETEQYQQFCDFLVNRRFIHHKTKTQDSVAKKKERLARTHLIYEKLFGHSPPDQFWSARQYDGYDFKQFCQCVVEVNDNVNEQPKLKKSKTHPSSIRQPGKVQLFVKTLSGKTITIDVFLSENVEDLKKKIEEKEGLPSCRQRLVFAGKQMEEGRKLSHYAIRKDSTIHLNLRTFIKNIKI